jgi:hypothetical protein
LANEKQLTLSSLPADDTTTKYASLYAPADVGYNLGDFRVTENVVTQPSSSASLKVSADAASLKKKEEDIDCGEAISK